MKLKGQKVYSLHFQYQHKLKPFQGAHIRFEGFPEDEEEHMREVLISNGGTVSENNDPNCTHVVSNIYLFLFGKRNICSG